MSRGPDTLPRKILRLTHACAAGRMSVDDATVEVLRLIQPAPVRDGHNDLCDYVCAMMTRVDSGELPLSQAARELVEVASVAATKATVH